VGERGQAPLALDPAILHGGVAEVALPAPPPGTAWRVEWAAWVNGTLTPWRAVAEGLGAGAYGVPDAPPVPQHLARWRAVPVPTDATDGAVGAGVADSGSVAAPDAAPHAALAGPPAVADGEPSRPSVASVPGTAFRRP
jgi:hypothetical protein